MRTILYVLLVGILDSSERKKKIYLSTYIGYAEINYQSTCY